MYYNDQIFQRFANANANPKTELKYTNNYTMLLAVMLSAQSTDVGVNKATEKLFKIVTTPEDILKLGEAKLKTYIKTIGLYNSKAKNIMATSKILVGEYDSKVPGSLESLIKLPGIGTKTAKVILNAAFGEPVIAVDTHVFRTAVRLGLSNKKTREKVEQDLEQIVPDKWKKNAHHWLVLHGRYICKARKPLCDRCLVSDLCEYFVNLQSS